MNMDVPNTNYRNHSSKTVIADLPFTQQHEMLEKKPYFFSYNWNQPYLESRDIAGFGLAIIMTLGPLAAYAGGFGA